MDPRPVPPPLEIVGSNRVRLWGLTSEERIARIAAACGLGLAKPGDEAGVLANAAYAFDPAWLRRAIAEPGCVLTLGGVPVLAHPHDEAQRRLVREVMAHAATLPGTALETTQAIEDKPLRKRERPFVSRLSEESVRAAERGSYCGAYKGVTDALTLYLWPRLAFHLTRLAARLGLPPNAVTAIGAALCVAATIAFARGAYWPGVALAFGFMVLDTVDGKLARCTLTASRLGNVLDHGIDLVHPPFWWWFWATGLSHVGLAYDSRTLWLVQGAIQGGYLVQRLIEGVFMRRNAMMHIHVWRRFDSRFRLVTARRNPNMAILVVSLLFARPDLGLIAVAAWTVASCAVHLVRLLQAEAARARGETIGSWLADQAPKASRSS